MVKKFIGITMGVLLLFTSSCLVGCGKGDSVDNGKTQIRIGNFNGGIGDEWLYSAIDKFEAAYADVPFEEGKTGVQIWVDNDKENYTDNTFFDKIGTTMKQDIHITNEITYMNFVNAGKFVEITDIVKEKDETVKDEETGEENEVSIADKMNSSLRDYYETDEGKYYAVPLVDAVYGIVYDVSLFEGENGHPGYYNDGYGPDGKEGTYDDGLPRTWEEFSALLDQMVVDNITPFAWAGTKNLFYRRAFMHSVLASYEGSNDYELNWNFSGTDSQFGAINEKNGWQLTHGRTAGI